MAFASAKKQASPLDEQALYDYALRSLGRRMRTEAELRRLMQSRVEPGEPGQAKMAAVLVRLKEYRYLDDTAYAADYTRLKQENARLGRRRVAQDLKGKGVASEIIADALDQAYEEVNEEALAREHLERKGVREPSNDKESARIMRMLLRAGFSMGTIYKLLKNWNVSEEALASIPENEHEVEPES